MKEEFTISIFTENTIGILNRISIIFTRRHLNISSITASESEVQNVHRYTLVLSASPEQVNKVKGQIEKLIDVLKVFVHREPQIVHQEIALYKVKNAPLMTAHLERIVRENYARILTVESGFIVIEKSGHVSDTQELFDVLKPYGVLEFARSGSVAVSKPMKELSTYLKELERDELVFS